VLPTRSGTPWRPCGSRALLRHCLAPGLPVASGSAPLNFCGVAQLQPSSNHWLSQHQPQQNMHSSFVLLASALVAGAAADIWTNGVWVEREPLPFGRSDMSVDFFGASVFIAGGCNGAQNCDAGSGYCSCSSITDDLVLYRADLDTYESMPPMPVNRYRHISCPWRDAIYFFGGRALSNDAIIRQVRGRRAARGELRGACFAGRMLSFTSGCLRCPAAGCRLTSSTRPAAPGPRCRAPPITPAAPTTGASPSTTRST